MTRRRIDRFIEEALLRFGDWYERYEWRGKEHDCVNLFAHGYLAQGVGPEAPIKDLTQIRIESAVRQPDGFANRSARKDLVIWRDGLANAWSDDWTAVHDPWVVMEWKWKSHGRPDPTFNSHDLDWLEGFTERAQQSLGYLVQVYDGRHGRLVRWAKVRHGKLQAKNRRS